MGEKEKEPNKPKSMKARIKRHSRNTRHVINKCTSEMKLKMDLVSSVAISVVLMSSAGSTSPFNFTWTTNTINFGGASDTLANITQTYFRTPANLPEIRGLFSVPEPSHSFCPWLFSNPPPPPPFHFKEPIICQRAIIC